MDAKLQRVRSLSISGLAAALAAMGVFAVYGAGAGLAPVVVFGGLALAAGVFGMLAKEPQLAAAKARRALPADERKTR